MSKGGRYGGEQSSLDYLFGSGWKQQAEASTSSPPVTKAPCDDKKNSSKKPPRSPSKKTDVSNNYHRAQSQNLGNFISGRPTTKVKSAPGGESSLGYLFGDKSSELKYFS